jgi:hypothetical protein
MAITVATWRAVNFGFRGAQRNEMVDSYRLRTMWVACSVA